MILCVGDTHGDRFNFRLMYALAERLDVSRVFVVGDFGYYPNLPDFSSALALVSNLACSSQIPLYFCDGNHEDLYSLGVVSADRTQFHEVLPCIFWSPRGHVWDWEGIRFCSMGGAHSIDRSSRIIGSTVFPDVELISASDSMSIMGKRCDILFTHDTLEEINLRVLPYEESASNRRNLSQIAHELSPTLLVHGHYHRHVDQTVTLGDKSTRVCGLACNKRPDQFALLDGLDLTFVDMSDHQDLVLSDYQLRNSHAAELEGAKRRRRIFDDC